MEARAIHGAVAGLAIVMVGVVSGCSSGGASNAARDKCESVAGVGRCLQRQGKWVPIGSINGTLPATTIATTTTTPSPTTRPTPTTTPARTLTGEFTLTQDQIKDDPLHGKHLPLCYGTNRYDDLRVGTQVVVTNPLGVVIATGSIDRAQWVNVHSTTVPGVPADTSTAGDCKLSFSVPHVPFGRFYNVQISHRSGATYSHAQLDAVGWHLLMTIG